MKSIAVSEETYRKLSELKTRLKAKTFDELIRLLILEVEKERKERAVLTLRELLRAEEKETLDQFLERRRLSKWRY
ncbi:MAG: hypothetical protein QXP31_08620 [Pyrobaculum sp.]